MRTIRVDQMPGVVGGAQRGNKFGARRTSCNRGHSHASKAEAMRCNDLHLLQAGGAIRALAQQPHFFFVLPDGRQVRDRRGKPVRYTADFAYDEQRRDGSWHGVVEDVKSRATMTEAAVLRMDFFRAFHPDIDLRLFP